MQNTVVAPACPIWSISFCQRAGLFVSRTALNFSTTFSPQAESARSSGSNICASVRSKSDQFSESTTAPKTRLRNESEGSPACEAVDPASRAHVHEPICCSRSSTAIGYCQMNGCAVCRSVSKNVAWWDVLTTPSRASSTL